MEFNYDLIMQPNNVVHCSTQEEADQLLEWANSKELKWVSGVSYTEINCWNDCTSDTCYDLSKGRYGEKQYYNRKKLYNSNF